MPSGSLVADAWITTRVRHHMTRDHFGVLPDSMVVLGADIDVYPAGMTVHAVLVDLYARLAVISTTSSATDTFTANAFIQPYFFANASIATTGASSFTANAVLARGGSITLDAVVLAGSSFFSIHSPTVFGYFDAITADDTHIYTVNGATGVAKYLRSDFSLVTTGTTETLHSRITHDNTYVYTTKINSSGAGWIYKWLKSDLSFVASASDFRLLGPRQITTDGTYLYVVSSSRHGAQKFLASDLSFVAEFGGSGAQSSDSGLSSPWGVTYHNGFLYIGDSGNARIMVLTASTMAYAAKQGSAGTGNDNYGFPMGVHVDPDTNLLYIADLTRDLVMVRTTDLTTLSYRGQYGSSPAELDAPQSVFASNNELYVSDVNNSRTVRLSTSSELSFTADAVVV